MPHGIRAPGCPPKVRCKNIKTMGGQRERPTTCNLRADGETALPRCGSGDDAGDLEDPVNSREAAEVTVRCASVSDASRETLKGIPDRTFDATPDVVRPG
jgi:hypothetical protein